MSYKYVAIIQARNEEKYIADCLNSVLNQFLKPEYILVVNDGSTDNTSKIVKKIGVNELYLNVKRDNRRGVNQSYAFNKGIKYINDLGVEYNYIAKFDSDIEIPSNYMWYMLNFINWYKGIGIVGGIPDNERIRLSRVTDSARIIKRECWEDIKGYNVCTAFDSIAVWKANNKGWKTLTNKNIVYHSSRHSYKYHINRWITSGQIRKLCYLPFYHTFLGALKNIKSGFPPIINIFFVMFGHLLYFPKKESRIEFIDKDYMKLYAIDEVKSFFKELF